MIRRAILAELKLQDRTRYWLADQIGVTKPSLYRMLSKGDHGFSTRYADAIFKVLKLRIVSQDNA